MSTIVPGIEDRPYVHVGVPNDSTSYIERTQEGLLLYDYFARNRNNLLPGPAQQPWEIQRQVIAFGHDESTRDRVRFQIKEHYPFQISAHAFLKLLQEDFQDFDPALALGLRSKNSYINSSGIYDREGTAVIKIFPVLPYAANNIELPHGIYFVAGKTDLLERQTGINIKEFLPPSKYDNVLPVAEYSEDNFSLVKRPGIDKLSDELSRIHPIQQVDKNNPQVKKRIIRNDKNSGKGQSF